MSDIIKIKEYPAIKSALKRAIPRYKKHSAIVCTADSLEISGTYWDGGSISSYLLCDLNGNNVESIPGSSAPPQFGGSLPETFQIPENKMVLKLGTFCGKPATVFIYSSQGVDA
jgi:hypothetical protein